jgi:hypothetical protein
LAPTALLVYRSSAVLQMPYAQWGTLVTVLSVLVKNKSAFSPQEHEWLCAYLTLQVWRPYMKNASASLLTRMCVCADGGGSERRARRGHPALRRKDR